MPNHQAEYGLVILQAVPDRCVVLTAPQCRHPGRRHDRTGATDNGCDEAVEFRQVEHSIIVLDRKQEVVEFLTLDIGQRCGQVIHCLAVLLPVFAFCACISTFAGC